MHSINDMGSHQNDFKVNVVVLKLTQSSIACVIVQKGGFVTSRHNELRDNIGKMLQEVQTMLE